VTDVLQDSISAIEKRIRELRHHLDEHDRLQRALRALRSASPRTAADGSANRRATSARRSSANSQRRGRPRKGQPTRKEQLAELVAKQPGITVAQAAKQLKMPKPNALYVVARDLTKSRNVRKQGAGYYPATNSRRATAKTAPKAAPKRSAGRRRRTTKATT